MSLHRFFSLERHHMSISRTYDAHLCLPPTTVLFWFVLMPLPGSLPLTVAAIFLVIHISSTYSAMAAVIMSTSAMSSQPIISQEEEEKLSPAELYSVLLNETKLAKRARVPINRQYRMDYHNYIR